MSSKPELAAFQANVARFIRESALWRIAGDA
jgi:hypothetical protein